jgi:type III pantothenate kinase
MNLAIDVGNTRVKAAFFSSNELLEQREAVIHNAESFVEELLAEHKVSRVILSSVVNHSDGWIARLASEYSFVLLDQHTPLPFINAYHTPETLGKDRLSAAAGALSIMPGKNVLVIDAGTCIKYDIITSEAKYLGGGISPGIKMRYKALKEFTQKLPELEMPDHQPELIGSDTNKSIHSGVMNGVVAELAGIMDRYCREFENLSVILTGGDSTSLKNLFSQKNNIFAEPLLVLKGLNFILNYNAKNS